ncbi:MAG: carbohydrate binding family 9 domain-containing protein [Saprospiraceae bacterium]|nr:carbohydrate binding family 9 domain-containing protein [Saprospiraceae bacterium]
MCWAHSHAQFSTPEAHELYVLKSSTPLIIDGALDEPIWSQAQPVGDFWEKFPSDKVRATLNTTVQAAYDDKFLYFAITSYDSTDRYIAKSLKRDASVRDQDGIVVILDPINNKSNGFGFSVTPYNVQSEYQFSANTGSMDLSTAWDNKWISNVKRYPDRYVVEMGIPFKTLRFDAEIKTWGVNFIRSDQKNNKFYTWTNVPVQFPGFDIGYLGSLVFEGELPSVKGNASLIPYVTGSLQRDPENLISTKAKINAGFDAKLSLTPSLNLDLTANPDFSQIEVDEQVTNLTRFDVFFPERRTFFLENDDIFSSYGPPPFRPFFSRKIGLDKDGNPIPIVFGGRLSGNLTEKLRVGLMNMQTARKGDVAAQNYSAISVHRRIFNRSLIKGYFLNHQSNLTATEEKNNPLDKYGRNAGLDIQLSDKPGSWQAWGGYHTSFKPDIKDQKKFIQTGGGYFGRKLNSIVDYNIIDKNYYADMGFVNRIETFASKGNNYDLGDTTFRNGFQLLYNQNDFFFYPKDKKIVRHSIGLENVATWFIDGSFSDRSHILSYRMFRKNASLLEMTLNVQQDNLRYYFPLPSDKPLEPGIYHYNNVGLLYESDSRKNILFTGGVRLGQYYNGTIHQYRAGVTVRQQPHWNITLTAEFNDLQFPKGYGDTQLWLISPKTEINFSNNLFWTTFFQYNTQQTNFNINSRIQWRYKPMSDLFLVYTDNYFTDTFINRNRAIVFKLNYWLTV